MALYEYKRGMYEFTHLPAFAAYILKHHLTEFGMDQIAVSREMKTPLLRYLTHLSDEQLIEFLKQSNTEYLTYLAENKAKEQITTALVKWQNDQLSIIEKSNISAEDIGLINFTRSKVLKKWAKNYPISSDEKFELFDEIDTLQFGATTSFTNIYIDTLKKKIQEELHFNELLINTSPGIIFIFDIQKQKEIYINGNVRHIMGFSPEEILTLHDKLLPTLTHPDDLPRLNDELQRIITEPDGRTHELEYRFRHKDGRYRWIRTYTIVFQRDEKGIPTQLLGCTFEISAQKEMELALEKRKSQLLEAQAIAQIGSYEWDVINDSSVATPQLLAILEIDSPAPYADFLQYVHSDDREKVKKALADSFNTGQYDCRYRYIVNDQEKTLWARGVVVFENNKPILMRGTVQDISQLKKIEDELTRKTRELERSNEGLQQFASIASHDLKEPLRKMSMYSDMVMTLEMENLSPASYTNLGKVKASSIRMQSMIEDILNFSSLTTEARKQKTSLKKIVQDAVEILQDIIQEKQAVIECDELPEANVIASQMRQLFQNLIGNAIKFSRKDIPPKISITHSYVQPGQINSSDIGRANRYLEIRVSDNGIGFRQDFSERIFELFTRLHSRETFEGSGLGLSICRRVIENHNGMIHATSQPGEGATFVMLIPA